MWTLSETLSETTPERLTASATFEVLARFSGGRWISEGIILEVPFASSSNFQHPAIFAMKPSFLLKPLNFFQFVLARWINR